VAPFRAHLISLKSKIPASPAGRQNPKSKINSKLKIKNSKNFVDRVYEELTRAGVEVLYDDREGSLPAGRQVSAGEKFADADLIGCPIRLVISEKTGEKIEWKERGKKDVKLLSLEELISKLV
jgi:prolyl-tRNA synthetase